MEYPERAECDFSSGGVTRKVDEQLELFDSNEVRCMHCNSVVPQPFFVKKHFGRISRDLPFCNEQHSIDYYINMHKQEVRP